MSLTRRAVVDQATRFAERLRCNMPDELAGRLRLKDDLPISTLRGGFADNRNWLEDPSQPAIVVAHTSRDDRIRLISARPAGRKERQAYHERIR